MGVLAAAGLAPRVLESWFVIATFGKTRTGLILFFFLFKNRRKNPKLKGKKHVQDPKVNSYPTLLVLCKLELETAVLAS